MRLLSHIVKGAALLAAFIIAASGVVKLWDLSLFELQLYTWKFFSHDVVRTLAVLLVPPLELIIGLLFLFAPGMRPRIALCIILMLGGYTCAYALEVHGGATPDCGCFDLLVRQLELRSGLFFLIVRNAALATPFMLFLGLLVGRGRRSSAPAWWSSPIRTRPSSRAFSFIELLVVMVVVSVLLALAIPSLRQVRWRGREAATLSNLRHHSTIALTYAQEHREILPYFTLPLPGPSSPIQFPDGRTVNVFYFDAYVTWKFALARGYYAGNLVHPSFVSPFRGEAQPLAVEYAYPCVFLAHQDYWQPASRTFPPEQLRPTRIGDVAHPSAKIVMCDEARWNVPRTTGERRAPGACIDGHGELIGESRMAPQYGNGDGTPAPFMDYTRHFASYEAFLHTLGGVSERDFYPARSR